MSHLCRRTPRLLASSQAVMSSVERFGRTSGKGRLSSSVELCRVRECRLGQAARTGARDSEVLERCRETSLGPRLCRRQVRQGGVKWSRVRWDRWGRR